MAYNILEEYDLGENFADQITSVIGDTFPDDARLTPLLEPAERTIMSLTTKETSIVEAAAKEKDFAALFIEALQSSFVPAGLTEKETDRLVMAIKTGVHTTLCSLKHIEKEQNEKNMMKSTE